MQDHDKSLNFTAAVRGAYEEQRHSAAFCGAAFFGAALCVMRDSRRGTQLPSAEQRFHSTTHRLHSNLKLARRPRSPLMEAALKTSSK